MGPGGGGVSARELEAMYREYLNGVAHSRPDSMPHPRGLVPPVQISAGQQGSHSGGIGSHTADGAPVSMAGAAPGMIRAGAAARLGEQLQWDSMAMTALGRLAGIGTASPWSALRTSFLARGRWVWTRALALVVSALVTALWQARRRQLCRLSADGCAHTT